MATEIKHYSLPIQSRPPLSWSRRLIAAAFFVLFNLACLMINGTQLVFLLPLKLLPFKWSKCLFDEGIRYTKGAFGCLLILMCQLFAPTKLSVSFETEGMGRIGPADIDRIIIKDKKDNLLYLNLPKKFVFIANHQVYADWWYAWCWTYFVGLNGVHRYVYITLKKSLQWVPVVGWDCVQGMQLFDFIFLARSWASDRRHLAARLSALGKRAEEEDNPFCFMLYPEGTLVSQDTRPISRKFAGKIGIADMDNMLLPRSTGLHYSLRSLAPRIPDLHLIDITMVYPGVPPRGYGQSFYTLRSIFMDGISPPAIHMHIRMFNVAKDIPIGDLTNCMPTVFSNGNAQARSIDIDIQDDEKDKFDEWLRTLWRQKDESITRFHEKRTFNARSSPAFEIPLKLRSMREALDAFCFFIPAGIGYIWKKLSTR